jgi:hypothetical protein
MRILKPIKMSSPRDITNLIAKLSPRSVAAGNMYVNTPAGSEVIVNTPQGPQAVPTVGSARSPGRLSPTTSAMLGVNSNPNTPAFTPGNANPDLSQFPTSQTINSLRTGTPIAYTSPVGNADMNSRPVTPRAVTFSQQSGSPRASMATPIPIGNGSPRMVSPINGATPIPIQSSPQLSPRMVPLPVPTSARALPRVSSVTGVSSPRDSERIASARATQHLIADEQRLVNDERQLIADERAAATSPTVLSARPALITPTYSNTARPSYSSQPRPASAQPISIQPLPVSAQQQSMSAQPMSIQPRPVSAQQQQSMSAQPMSIQPRPVSTQQQSMSAQPMSIQPRPVSAQPRPVSAQPRPVSAQPMSIQPRPVSAQQQQSMSAQPTPIPIQRSPQSITPISIQRSPVQLGTTNTMDESSRVITPISIQRSPQPISVNSRSTSPVSSGPTSLTPQVMVTPRTASLSPERSALTNIPTRVSTPIPIPVTVSPQAVTFSDENGSQSPRSTATTLPRSSSPNGLPMPGSVRSAPTPIPIIRTPTGRTPGAMTTSTTSPVRTPGTLPSVSTPGRVSVLGPSASEKGGINDLNDFLRSHHYTPIKYTGQSIDKVDFVKAYSPLGPICYIAINITGQATITTSDMNLFTINNDQDVAKSSDINAASGIVNTAIGAAIECRDGICTNTTYQGLDNIPVGITTFVTQEKMDASKSRYDLSSGDSLSYPIILASSIQTDATGIARAVYDAAMKLRKTALGEQVATLSKLTQRVAASAEGLVRFNLALEKDLDTAPGSLISLNTNALLEKRAQLMNNGEYPLAQIGVDNTNVNAANQAILSTEAWLNRFDDMTHKHINLAASLASNMELIEQFQNRIYDHTAQLFLSAFTISDPALSDVNGFFNSEAWGLPASFAGVKDFTALTPQQWEEATAGNSNSAQLARALQRAVTAMMV